MCGIGGVLYRNGRPVDRELIARMGDSIAHRGPDGEGFHVEQAGDVSVGLVSRRLAVIDVAGGEQPMVMPENGQVIVYNGEIFNAAELRSELESAGHRFRTRCDTEVVLRGFAQWGADVLERLNGMWAFAIWDPRDGRLFLARDRLGVKPLVYAEVPGGIVFASEIKALTASGLVARELEPAALPHYMSFFAVPEPYSLVHGVRRLPSGHSLVADAHGVRERRYWDCALAEEDDRGARAYRDEVAGLLEDAVARRLVSDVPLGLLLSSGIDSRLVATFAARGMATALRTFTLGFDAPDADERADACNIAAALSADHREAVIGAHEAAGALPSLLAAYDEPGQSLVQNHFVCRLARQDVTVALSGLGGDELFSSYPSHVVANLLGRLDRVPRRLREQVIAVGGALPNARLRHAAELAAMSPDERVSSRLLHQTDRALRRDMLAVDVRAEVDVDAPARHLETHFERARGQHPLNRLLYVYLKTYLPDELLRSVDAMSMLNSLEVRTPFLDYRLVERAMSIPARHKMRLVKGKLVLRDVAERDLPEPVARVKRGFSPPLTHWLQGELQEQIRDVLAPASVRRRGVFDPGAVERVLKGALGGDARLVPPAMMLYAFECWAQGWLDEPAPRATSSPVVVERGEPSLSVIVVNWNTRERLRACLGSIDRHLGQVDHEVLVVDNASSDGSAEMVTEEFPAVRLMRNAQNIGFGRANNQAMRAARGRWLLLLNSDTELRDDSVARLLPEVRSEPGIGVAHCRLEFPDGRLQHTTYRFPRLHLALIENLGLYKLLSRRRTGALLLGGYWEQDEARDVDWVSGAFMLLPREVFTQAGGFDERLFMYGEDLEWCYRIREQGWRIRYYPQASVVHFDHTSSEIRWGDGDERVALCLRRQHDTYVERRGRARGAAFMALALAGAVLRTVYYAARSRVPGPRAEGYRDMHGYAATSLRILAGLALGRR